jgi:hypothetical protein
MITAAPAGATGSYAPTPGTAKAVVTTPVTAGHTAAPSDGTSSSLPFTGADVTVVTLVGAGAVGAGGLMVLAVRNRRRTPEPS